MPSNEQRIYRYLPFTSTPPHSFGPHLYYLGSHASTKLSILLSVCVSSLVVLNPEQVQPKAQPRILTN